MGDLGDTFRALKEQQKAKRKCNTASSTKLLIENGIEFQSKNNGATDRDLVLKLLSIIKRP